MSVPDTNTFSLQDVVDEVNPTVDSLQTCVDESNLQDFDPNYMRNRDRLSNFRNYGGYGGTPTTGLLYWENVTSPTDSLECSSSTSWSIVRGDTSADSKNGGGYYKVWVEYDGIITYTINRGFIQFDLSSLPLGATFDAAEIYFRVDNEYGDGTHDIEVLDATYSDPIVNGDYNNFTFNNKLFTNPSTRVDGIPDYIAPEGSFLLKKVATASDLTSLEAYSNSTVQMAIILDSDNNNEEPDDKRGFDIWRSGEATGGLFSTPMLLIWWHI